MSKIPATLCVVLLAACASGPGEFPPPAGPARDLVGDDLSRWRFEGPENDRAPAEAFQLADDLLWTDGTVPGALRTAAQHADYELTLEWRWGPGVTGGNSGLLVHAGEPRVFHGWPRCLEVQLRSGSAGDLILMDTTLEPVGGTLDGVRVARRPEVVEHAEGDWNRLRVRCQGDEVVVWVNDVLANRARRLSRARGALALQSEGAEIHFRAVRLAPL